MSATTYRHERSLWWPTSLMVAEASRPRGRPNRFAMSVPDGKVCGVTPKTWQEIETAVRAAWSLDTCDPADVDDWSPANAARGQCGSTTLTVNDLLGGELLVAEVLYTDGTRQGFHWWNRLPDGSEVDLTREQFGAARTRPAAAPRRAPRGSSAARRRAVPDDA